MNDQKLQQLADTLASDPSFHDKGEWLSDHQCAVALNGAPPVTISRNNVAPKEVLACILPSVWKALDQADRDLLQLILAGDKPVDFTNALTQATFDELFPAGTVTGDALLAVVRRTVAPTEAAYGREVNAADIERAKRVSEGLHPDVRSPDEPVMAKLFAEKHAKEAQDEIELIGKGAPDPARLAAAQAKRAAAQAKLAELAAAKPQKALERVASAKKVTRG